MLGITTNYQICCKMVYFEKDPSIKTKNKAIKYNRTTSYQVKLFMIFNAKSKQLIINNFPSKGR